jgi:3D (Asp-Asp-Asp) domain-containing protein
VELILTALLLGNLQVTSYRSVPSQTDDSPWITSIGERVNNHGVAVSQDLLRAGRLHYGDTIYIEGYGFKVVNDCMNERIKNAIDIWVATRSDEHKVGVRNLKVWVIKCQQRKVMTGRLTGLGTGVELTDTTKRTSELTPMSSQMRTALTPGTDWQSRKKQTSMLITEP